MDGQVAIALRHSREAPPVREREFSLASEAAEYRDDVLGSFIRLIYNEHASVGHRSQQR